MNTLTRRLATFAAAAGMTVTGLVGLGTAPASAAPVELDCGTTLAFLGADPSAKLLQFSAAAEGYSYRISKRKQLVVNRISRIGIDGNCRVDAVADVTLKRKIRRDAHGSVKAHATLVGRIDDQTWATSACLTGTNIDDINLSNTLNLGEAVYRGVANRMLPSGFCIDL